jgi:hypothetical protein
MMTDERMTRRFWISDEAFEGLLESFIDGYLEKDERNAKTPEVPNKRLSRKKNPRPRAVPKLLPHGVRDGAARRDDLG